MYALISTVLFAIGLAGLLLGYVECNEVFAVLGYIAALAGITGLVDVFGGNRTESY